MKYLKVLLVALVFVFNMLFMQSSWADLPPFQENPDYIDITKTLTELQKQQDIEIQNQGSVSEETQNKIAQLEFQKYTLESGINWGQCTNKTGQTLAVYGSQQKEDDEDYEVPSRLYFLADGQTTKKKWDCDGFYLPSGLTANNVNPLAETPTLEGPVAIKIVDGTELILSSNSETKEIEFDAPSAQVFQTNESDWFIPNVSQAIIDSHVTNAPTQKS
ncbi:MAG: hypothetical protein ACOVQ7_13970 [Limnoraphis robusta]